MPSPKGRPGAYSSRRERDRQKVRAQNRRGVIMLAISALAAGGLVVGASAMSGPKINPADGCRVGEHTSPAHTIVLIDQTDKLSRRDLEFARDLIQTEYFWLPEGGRLTVRNITADPDEAEDISVCRMDDGSGSWGMFRNKNKMKKDFQKIVGTKLEALIAALAEAEPQKASPILEAISGAPERSDFGRGVANRRLVVLSDFAQHSDLASHYGGRGFDLSDEALSALEETFDGVAVRLQYVKRRELAAIQGAEHKAFWKDHLEEMGAAVEVGHDLHLGEDPSRETWTDEIL